MSGLCRVVFARGQSNSRGDGRKNQITRISLGIIWEPALWIKAIGFTVRITQHAGGTESDKVRYYRCTRYLSGNRFGKAVRGRWGIESMHWVLDVNFREDDSRTRERTLGNNLSWLRRLAVTLMKRHPDKDSLRGKMISCGLNTNYLTQVLSL